MRTATQEPEPHPKPTSCPFCGSSRIKTTSEKTDASSYWRCEGCGDMWNVDRLKALPSRPSDARRWW